MSLSHAFSATFACFILVLAINAKADDGRIEINQAAALAGGVASGDAPGFPVLITLPGSYVLTGDLTVTDPNFSAILVGASRVTLDLNGFSLIGAAGCSGAGAGIECTNTSIWDGIRAVGHDQVTVRNGFIRGFGRHGVALRNECRVIGVTTTANGDDGINGGTGCIVRDSIAANNGGDGIHLSHNTVLVSNVAVENRLEGIRADEGSVFLENTARLNGGNGIAGLFGGNVLHRNNLQRNGDNGLRASDGAIVTHNISRENHSRGMFLNPTAGYTRNVITTPGGAGSAVLGGVSMGTNGCDNFGC